MYSYDSKKGNLFIVERYRAGGLNVIPLRTDGTKAPAIKTWKPYHTKQFPLSMLQKHWGSKGNPAAIGIVCGETSGNLEVMDFDKDCSTIFPVFCQQVEHRCQGLLATLPLILTPKPGKHLYYRCEKIGGGEKLAEDDTEKRETLIETRGQGNYVVAPGSPPRTHNTRRPYKVIQGDPANTPTITLCQREILLDVARGFNRCLTPSKPTTNTPHTHRVRVQCVLEWEEEDCKPSNRPGDDFNKRGKWADILCPHGWRYLYTNSNGVEYWQRPDKIGLGCSAQIGFDRDKMDVFSTDASPLAQGSYSKFAAYTLLEHHGDYEAAAAQLHEEGYGEHFDYDIDTLLGGYDYE